MKPIKNILEAILFTEGGPVSRKRLIKVLQCQPLMLEELIDALKIQYNESGVVLADDGTTVALVTNPTVASSLKQLEKEEIQEDLSHAMQETLSIISYTGPISKTDIDFLRGVNTQFTLRRLLMRGLIQEQRKGNSRMFSVTVEFLNHLGITEAVQLENYETTRNHIVGGLVAIKKRMRIEESTGDNE